MTHPLSKIPILGPFVDERFLEHRRRSSSFAGIAAACLALALFEYRYFWGHVWSWDLLSIALVFVVIKLSMMLWFRAND
ncbi:MAG: hypothetical protein WCC26_19955 [Terracidiphilus sp.]